MFYPFVAGLDERIQTVSCTTTECTLTAEKQLTTGGESTVVLPAYKRGQKIVINGWAFFTGPDSITLSFGNNLRLLSDGQSYPLPELEDMTLSGLTLDSRRAILDLGDRRPYLVEGEKLTHFAVEMVVGEPITINVIDASGIDNIQTELNITTSRGQSRQWPATVWTDVLVPAPIQVATDSKLEVRWAVSVENLDFLQESVANNCDVAGRGRVNKTPQGRTAVYLADDYGTACEGYALSSLSSLNDYLLQIEATNVDGHPVQFFVNNNATRKLLSEQVLTKNDTQHYYYIPQLQTYNNQQTQLSFHLNNKSYGKQSHNRVSQIRFIYYPINYLSRIKMVLPGRDLDVSRPQRSIKQADQVNLSRYHVRLATTSQQLTTNHPTLLVLDRAYNRNWLAWGKTNSGWRRLEQVMFDSWANAWVLPPDETISEVKIIFWPQRLVLMGWSLCLLELLVVGAYGYHVHRHHRRRPPICRDVFDCPPERKAVKKSTRRRPRRARQTQSKNL